jgi:hypothetical protein
MTERGNLLGDTQDYSEDLADIDSQVGHDKSHIMN